MGDTSDASSELRPLFLKTCPEKNFPMHEIQSIFKKARVRALFVQVMDIRIAYSKGNGYLTNFGGNLQIQVVIEIVP